jgi:chemotaxis protein methyltransferase CheR
MQPEKNATLPLADGELTDDDVRELGELKRLIEARSGFNCGSYKEKCLRRRIAVRMRARGVHRYGEYARLLPKDPAEYDRLLDALTINISKFFRNREVWESLRTHVFPRLFELRAPEIRIWSAGCASGEEPYSLTIELIQYAEQHGLEAQLSRFRVLGTDIDRESLANAERGQYSDFALTDTPPEIRDRWFSAGQPRTLSAVITSRVDFAVLDLMNDPFPSGQHLIVCRNVIIYFERSVQEALFERFRDALEPDGIMVLGKVETLFGPIARSFRPLAGRDRVFVKV